MSFGNLSEIVVFFWIPSKTAQNGTIKTGPGQVTQSPAHFQAVHLKVAFFSGKEHLFFGPGASVFAFPPADFLRAPPRGGLSPAPAPRSPDAAPQAPAAGPQRQMSRPKDLRFFGGETAFWMAFMGHQTEYLVAATTLHLGGVAYSSFPCPDSSGQRAGTRLLALGLKGTPSRKEQTLAAATTPPAKSCSLFGGLVD